MNVHSASTVDTGKRAAILRAALQVFAAHGVHGTAVPEIAAAAQVGVGTVYRYFTNKEQLVNELFRDTKRRLKARLGNGLDLTLPPKALFDAFWSRLVAFAREEPQAFQFLELQDHLAYLDQESRDVELDLLAPIWLVCLEFRKKGLLDPAVRPEVAMALIWGAFVGAFKAERNGYFTLAPADLAFVRDTCWRGITISHE